MPISRADVDRLTDLRRESVAMAVADLQMVFETIDLSDPKQARDALLEIVPALTREHGEVAATAAAEWYEDMRAREAGGLFTARLGNTADEAAVEGTVRWTARNLWEEGATGAVVSELTGAMQRYVSYAARDTVTRNVTLDPRRPRFARVLSGTSNCAFCLIMSSRGFEYHSRVSAGERGSGNEFHDDCDCEVVPQWDSSTSHISGYDPDELYDTYKEMRKELGDLQAADLATEMRVKFPDRFH